MQNIYIPWVTKICGIGKWRYQGDSIVPLFSKILDVNVPLDHTRRAISVCISLRLFFCGRDIVFFYLEETCYSRCVFIRVFPLGQVLQSLCLLFFIKFLFFHQMCFLFHLKSFFCSRDIQVFVIFSLLHFPDTKGQMEVE